MKTLENCQRVPRWVSHMGCLKGCLDFLGIEISEPWLYGGTGHACVINLHKGVCPSGPTAWNTSKLYELGPNLGYKINGVFGVKHRDDFPELQARAFEHVRQAIDQGYPCYGWELEIPEFYVIYGYDDAGPDYEGGYYFSGPGCDEGKGPKSWKELGDTGIGVLEVYSVAPGEPADDVTTVKAALSFALEHAANPKEWIWEDYASGVNGFDNWIGALEAGKASDMGMRYNTGVWLECRQNAVGFLREAKARLPGRAGNLFDEAAAHYQVVTDHLKKVSEICPWSYEADDEAVLPVNANSEAAVKALRTAREAEAAGLATLQKIVAVL
ncbi:MAG: hypothetical protein JXC32_09665 [Anaerolineae bacterium]|nr:hypothetical protein [Anaerolineae bacterium]